MASQNYMTTKNSIEIFAFCGDSVPGVKKKLRSISNSFFNNGFIVKLSLFEFSMFRSHFSYIYSIYKSNKKYLFVRIAPNCLANYFLLPVLSFKRFKKHYVIIEIPTPLHIGTYEILSSDFSLFKKIYYLLNQYFNFPLSILPAHRILQYGEESFYFSAFIRHKFKLISNGIETDRLSKRVSYPRNTSIFKFVGIATIGRWHGYDRLIESISEHNKTEDVKCYFDIIGDGPEKDNLVKLVDRLDVAQYVTFHGFIDSSICGEYLSNCHMAVTTLAGHRANLYVSSELKSREYCASGIPFISSQIDPDFGTSTNFIYLVPNDDLKIELNDVINWYYDLSFDDFFIDEMHNFAVKNLDYDKKVIEYINGL